MDGAFLGAPGPLRIQFTDGRDVEEGLSDTWGRRVSGGARDEALKEEGQQAAAFEARFGLGRFACESGTQSPIKS